MPQEGFLGKARGRDNGGQRHGEGSHLGDSQSIALRLHPKSNGEQSDQGNGTGGRVQDHSGSRVEGH